MVHQTFPVGTRISNLEIVNILGEGAYGQVYLAKQVDCTDKPPKMYAIKSLRQLRLDVRQRAYQRTEIGLHAVLSGHPNIIRLERVIREPEWTHVVLEYGPEGDLFSAITERGRYYGNHSLIKHVFLQLIEAVSYCHQNGIYHRDLKPENILVFDQDRTIKLADFGLATTEQVTTEYGCGSTFYFSPECQGDVRKERVAGYATAPNDVWALGVILINLAAGRNPWRQASLNDDTFCAYLADPNFLLKILPISRELNHILKRIFCVDPIRRISLDELRNRIKRCRYFTRTPLVERLEREMSLAASTTTTTTITTIKTTRPKVVLPPSPPASPRRSQSSSFLKLQLQQLQPTSQGSEAPTTTAAVATTEMAAPDEALVQNLMALSV